MYALLEASLSLRPKARREMVLTVYNFVDLRGKLATNRNEIDIALLPCLSLGST